MSETITLTCLCGHKNARSLPYDMAKADSCDHCDCANFGHYSSLSRTPSHGRVSGDLRKALEHIKMDAEEALFPHGPVMADALRKIAERVKAALSTPAENGDGLAALNASCASRGIDPQAAPIPVEGEVTIADRKLADQIYNAMRDEGWFPSSKVAEMIARHRLTFSRGADEDAILWAAHSAICDVGFANEKPSPAQYSEVVRNALIAALSTIKEPRG